jgi:hypothetical protein
MFAPKALAAQGWFGYGRWDAPYWFVGTEPGGTNDHASYDASVRLGILAGALAYERLRCMEGGKVSVASSILHDTGGEDDPGARQAFPRLVEVRLRLWRHTSMPSRRISRISGVRSS